MEAAGVDRHETTRFDGIHDRVDPAGDWRGQVGVVVGYGAQASPAGKAADAGQGAFGSRRRGRE